MCGYTNSRWHDDISNSSDSQEETNFGFDTIIDEVQKLSLVSKKCGNDYNGTNPYLKRRYSNQSNYIPL